MAHLGSTGSAGGFGGGKATQLNTATVRAGLTPGVHVNTSGSAGKFGGGKATQLNPATILAGVPGGSGSPQGGRPPVNTATGSAYSG